MKIVDQRRDYYDSLKSTDPEKEPLYIRNQSTVEVEWAPHCDFQFEGNDYSKYNVKCGIVGFCSNLYPFIQITYLDPNDPLANKQGFVTTSFWSIDKLDQFMYTRSARIQVNYFGFQTKRGRYGSRGNANQFLSLTPRSFLLNSQDPYREFRALFDKYNTPIFLWERNYFKDLSVVLNPLLRPTQFYKIIPPPQAWQTLYAYLCNRTNPEKPIPKISDEMKAQAHGFDKHSFRMEAPGKKPRGRKKRIKVGSDRPGHSTFAI